jgi:hypothetical protein
VAAARDLAWIAPFYRTTGTSELPNSRGNPQELARFFGVKVTNRKHIL